MPDELVTPCINKDYLTLPYLTLPVLSLFPSKTGETLRWLIFGVNQLQTSIFEFETTGLLQLVHGWCIAWQVFPHCVAVIYSSSATYLPTREPIFNWALIDKWNWAFLFYWVIEENQFPLPLAGSATVTCICNENWLL